MMHPDPSLNPPDPIPATGPFSGTLYVKSRLNSMWAAWFTFTFLNRRNAAVILGLFGKSDAAMTKEKMKILEEEFEVSTFKSYNFQKYIKEL